MLAAPLEAEEGGVGAPPACAAAAAAGACVGVARPDLSFKHSVISSFFFFKAHLNQVWMGSVWDRA